MTISSSPGLSARGEAATGGTKLSLHTFGLAVDLNYKGNPFFGNAGRLAPDIVKRATGLVLGHPIDLMTSIGEAKAAYATLTATPIARATGMAATSASRLRSGRSDQRRRVRVSVTVRLATRSPRRARCG